MGPPFRGGLTTSSCILTFVLAALNIEAWPHAQKLSCQTFDASQAFTFCHDTSADPQWTVICLKVQALASTGADVCVLLRLQGRLARRQDLAAGGDVWLVDHLVTFGKAEELLQGLESDPSLLHRLAELMEVDGAVPCPRPALAEAGTEMAISGD